MKFKEYIQLQEARRPATKRQTNGQPNLLIIGDTVINLFYDTGLREFMVYWIQNKHIDGTKTYYTTDMTDALGTMKLMAREVIFNKIKKFRDKSDSRTSI